MTAPCTANIHFTWSFSDPEDGSTQTGYQLQVATNPGFGNPVFDSGSVTSSAKERYVGVGNPLSFNTNYYWRIRVRDSGGTWSSYANGVQFTTPEHAAPVVDFSWTPQNPSENEAIQFTDESSALGGATITGWNWSFTGGSPSSSSSQNPSTVFSGGGTKDATLTATDSDSFSCSLTQSVSVQLPLPDIDEVPPVSGLWFVDWIWKWWNEEE